jgi:hypothetical protein
MINILWIVLIMLTSLVITTGIFATILAIKTFYQNF